MTILIAAAFAWLVLALTRKRALMLAGAAILAGAWLWTAPAAPAVPALSKAAALVPQSKAARGSCAEVADGMTGDEVLKRLGEPDEVRGDEEARGPGAKILIYRGSRCAVHVFDDRVEFTE